MADDHHPLEALNARGLTAKREYVRGLEQRRDPEALSLLVECLCDESWFLRDLAEQAFVRLGEEHAGPLVPMLSGGLWYTRLSAARLLGRLGYRPAVPALLALCDDTNETVAIAARDAMLAVARLRGSTRIAHALVRLAPEKKRQRLEEIAARDRVLAKTIERWMADVDLMAADRPDQLVDKEETAAPADRSGAGTAAPRAPRVRPGAAPAPRPVAPHTATPVEPKSPAPGVPAKATVPSAPEKPAALDTAAAPAKPAASASPEKPAVSEKPDATAATAAPAKPAASASPEKLAAREEPAARAEPRTSAKRHREPVAPPPQATLDLTSQDPAAASSPPAPPKAPARARSSSPRPASSPPHEGPPADAPPASAPPASASPNDPPAGG